MSFVRRLVPGCCRCGLLSIGYGSPLRVFSPRRIRMTRGEAGHPVGRDA